MRGSQSSFTRNEVMVEVVVMVGVVIVAVVMLVDVDVCELVEDVLVVGVVLV